MLQEFKDFINKGNLVMTAVALIMALYFQKIIDALLEGVLYPIIAALFGKPDFRDIGFVLREGEDGEADTILSIGLVIDAVISFLIVAVVLFFIVKAYNNMKKDEEEDSGPTEVDLLTDIRDQLRANNN